MGDEMKDGSFVSVRGCLNCGVLYLLQDKICAICKGELRIYDLPVMEKDKIE